MHVDAEAGSSAGEVSAKTIVQILFLVVHETLHGLARTTLLAVEQVRRLEPGVAQHIDVEDIVVLSMGDVDLTFGLGLADHLEGDAKLTQHAVGDAVVGDLDDHRRLLAEEHSHEVLLVEGAQVEVYAVGRIGEVHLQQSGDQTTCRHVVTGQNQVALDEHLDGVEALLEVIDALHIGHGLTDGTDALCEAAATQLETVFREVDVKELGVLVSLHHGSHNLADIGDFAGGGNDDRSRGDNFLAVRVFLRHGEAVLTRRHVDAQSHTVVAQCLDGFVETGGLTLLFGRPHPVGAQRHTFEVAFDGSPEDVGQSLGDRQA